MLTQTELVCNGVLQDKQSCLRSRWSLKLQGPLYSSFYTLMTFLDQEFLLTITPWRWDRTRNRISTNGLSHSKGVQQSWKFVQVSLYPIVYQTKSRQSYFELLSHFYPYLKTVMLFSLNSSLLTSSLMVQGQLYIPSHSFLGNLSVSWGYPGRSHRSCSWLRIQQLT